MPTFFEKPLPQNAYTIESPTSLLEIADWFEQLKQAYPTPNFANETSPSQQTQTLMYVGFILPIISQYLTHQCYQILEKHHDSEFHIYSTLHYQLKAQEQEYNKQTQLLLNAWFGTDLSEHDIALHHFKHVPTSMDNHDTLSVCLNLFMKYLKSEKEKYKKGADAILDVWFKQPDIKKTYPLYLSIALLFECFQSSKMTFECANGSNFEYTRIAHMKKKISKKLHELRQLLKKEPDAQYQRSHDQLTRQESQLSNTSLEYENKAQFFARQHKQINKDTQTVAHFIKNLLENDSDLMPSTLLETEDNITKLNHIFSVWQDKKCWVQGPIRPISQTQKEPIMLERRVPSIRFSTP